MRAKHALLVASSRYAVGIRFREPGLHLASMVYKIGSTCSWPEEDGRKLRRTKSPPQYGLIADSIGASHVPDTTPGPFLVPSIDTSHYAELDREQPVWLDHANNRVQNSVSLPHAFESPHTVLQYHRHLGPTAIAPGYKNISLKVKTETASQLNGR